MGEQFRMSPKRAATRRTTRGVASAGSSSVSKRRAKAQLSSSLWVNEEAGGAIPHGWLVSSRRRHDENVVGAADPPGLVLVVWVGLDARAVSEGEFELP